ncbi:MAG: T9SS type A sorting domain-containing protein [Chitinophagaceae bacterium]|nr:T9SS type A sorting domain-containing protein [Chitinophagaceae bacterium]
MTNSIDLISSMDTDLKKYTHPIRIKAGPNPAFNTIYIYIEMLQPNQEITISILSNTGNVMQTVKTNSSAQSIKIDISSLVNGTYFVQAISGNNRVSQQFVKH